MSENNQYGDRPTSGTVTVAISAQLSDAFNLHGCTFVAFETPAAITGTTYSFYGSIDNGATYAPIYDKYGVLVSFTAVAASRSYPIDNANLFIGYDKIKINTGTNEAAARTIKVKAYPI
jgi:hypothetical protein